MEPKPTSENQSISEIKNPEVRGRLTAMQESVSELDEEIAQKRKAIDEKRGVVAAARAISERIFQECNVVQKKIDTREMTMDEGRLRIDQIQRIVGVVRNIERDNQTDYDKLQGQMIGLQKAVDLAAKRFSDISLKHERHERMEQEDLEARRAVEPVEQPAVPKARKGGRKKKV